MCVVVELGWYVEEGWYICKDGMFFWVIVVMMVLCDSNNVLIGFGIVISDMSEKKVVYDVVFNSEWNFWLLV